MTAQTWEIAKVMGANDGQTYTNGTILENDNTIYGLTQSSGNITDGKRKHERKKGDFLLLTKFNPNGIVAWERRFSSNSGVSGTVLRKSPDGYIYGSGYFQDSLEINNIKLKSQGNSDIFLFKSDKDGNILWLKSFGAKKDQTVGDMVIDKNNNVILTGMFAETWSVFDSTITNEGSFNVFVLKLNSEASQCIWTFASKSTPDDYPSIYFTPYYRLSLDLNQNVYLSILKPTKNFFTIGSQLIKSNSALLKLNRISGDVAWVKNIRTGNNTPLYITSNDAGHMYMATGFNDTLKVGNDFVLSKYSKTNLLLSKFDTNGVWYWNKLGGSLGTAGAKFTGITSSGTNLYAMGISDLNTTFNGKSLVTTTPVETQACFICAIDSAGDLQKSTFYGKAWVSSITCLNVNKNGSMILSGNMTDGFQVANSYIVDRGGYSSSSISSFTLLTDPNLQPVWNNSIGAGGGSFGYDVVMGKKNSYYIAGCVGGLAILDSDTLLSSGGDEGFVSKYDEFNKIKWTKQFKGLKDDAIMSIARDNKDNLFVLGRYYSPKIQLDQLELSVNTLAGTKLFMAKLDSNGIVKWLVPVNETYNGSYSSQDYSIAVSMDGTKIFVAYNMGNKTSIQRFDALGNSLGFVSCSSTSSNISDLCLYKNKIYLVGNFGSTLILGGKSITSVGAQDLFIGEMELDGTINWIKNHGGTSNQYGKGITVNNNGLYIVGSFNSAAKFNEQSFTSTSDHHYILKADLQGNVIKAIAPSNTGFSPYSYGLKISNDSSNVYMVGSFYGSIAFPGKTISASISEESYLASFDCELGFKNAYTIISSGVESPYSVSSSNYGTVMTGYVSPEARFNGTQISGSGYTYKISLGRVKNELESCKVVTDFKDNNLSTMSLWPNPSNDEFHVTLDRSSVYEISVFDNLGNELKSIVTNSADIIFGKDLKPGLYLMYIKTNGQSFSEKLIKQ